MRRHLLLTLALVLGPLTGAWAYDWASANGAGAVYYNLNSPNAGEATVVAGEWQYRDNVVIPGEITVGGNTYRVTTIGANAFYYCYDVISVTLGENVTTIKKGAFTRSSGPSRTIYDEKQGKNVTISGIVINIDSEALTTIEENAFSVTTLAPNKGADTLAIGKNVAGLSGTSTFFNWVTFSNVKHYYVDPSSETLCVDADGVLYNKGKTKLYLHPQQYLHKTFEIPSTVKYVASFAFYSMQYQYVRNAKNKIIDTLSLKKIIGGENVEQMGSVVSGTFLETLPIGKKVTTMSTTALMYVGQFFLPKVDDNNPVFKLKDSVLYKYASPDTILCQYFKIRTNPVFVVPSMVTKIAEYSFYSVNVNLDTIDYINCTKEKLKTIDGTAFLSTKNSLKFINEDKLFDVDEYGVIYTDGFKGIRLYASDITTETYNMPEATIEVPRNVIKSNGYVKNFNINKNCTSINTEHLYIMNNLEAYSVNPANTKYYSDESGVLYEINQTTKKPTILRAYPTANDRIFYKVVDGTTNVGVAAFRENKYLVGLDLGDNIKSVVDGNSNNLYKMASLNYIRVGTTQPPTVTTSSFDEDMYKKKTILYVPASAYDIYKKTSIWNRFAVMRDTGQFKSDVMDAKFEYDAYHYKENLAGDGWEVPESVTWEGYILKPTAAEPRSYEGFEQTIPYEQVILDRKGIIIPIYYTRKCFSVTWKNGTETISTKNYKYGAQFLQDKPADPTPDAGKHFLGWNTNPDALVAISFDGSETVRAQNIIYYAIFADNASKKYHVEHYQQNANDDDYTKVDADTEEDSKPFGLQTTATAKTYEGFTAQSFSQQTIAEDESTVVKIYYDRDFYTVTWMNGSTTVLSNDYKYGSALVVPADQTPVAGQHFVGWNTNQSAKTGLPVNTQTVPLNGVTFYAIFADNDSKPYTVEHYQQNLDEQTYTRIDADTEIGSGTKGLLTSTTPKNYPGFTAQPYNEKTIAESGTVVEIYYNRNKYDVIWKKGTSELSRNANVLFGEAISKPADPQADAGYHFAGWNTDSQATSAMNLSGATVPVGGITYYAVFAINATVHYTVKHYQESLNGGYPDEPENVDEGTGVFGLKTTATARSYDGFTAQPFNQEEIKEDESTVVRIEYKRNTHTLAWNANGGIFSGNYTSGFIKYGAQVIAPTYTRTGYDFKGWGLSEDATSWEVVPATMPDADLTYYANWQVHEYPVTWDFNNGSGEFSTSYVAYGQPIAKADGEPTKDNYHFLGWSSEKNGTPITNGNYGIMQTSPVTFYAQWEIDEFQLTWDANGGETVNAGTHGSVAFGTTPLTPATVKRTGYTQKGWATSPDATSPTNVLYAMPNEDLTYYAVWEINQRTITWNANGGVLATAGTNGKVNYNTQITPATTADRVGYTFIGWNTSADATTTIEPATTMPDNDLTYYAVWQVHQHNLKWYPNGGSFTNSDPSGLVNYGDTIKMPLVNRTDYKMSGWGLTQDATPDDVVTPEETMPDNDLTYYAIWILKTNYVTWKLNYYADDDKNHTSTSVDVGNPIVAPTNAPTRPHYQFIGWSETRDGEPIDDFGIMDTNKKTYYAIWQINSNTLAWDANGGTILSNGTNGTVEFDTPLTPATAERTGYAFKGWALSSTATVNDTVRITTMPDAPTTYFAVWAPKTYQVEWKYNSGTNENFAVTDAVFDGDIKAPNSYPARDYNDFEGWAATPEGDVLSDYGKLTTEGATFYAKWQLKKFTLAWDANGGELSGEYTQGKVEYGTKINAPTATLANYIFAGWGTSAKPDSIVNVTTMPDSSLTLVANWLANTYVVEWRMNDGTDDNYTATNVDYGNAIIAPADPERTNYQFLGWMDENGELVDDFGTMQTDHVIFYAQWQKNSHELTWNANGGQLSGDYTSGNVEVGTEIVRPVAERTGYTFNGWNTYVDAVDSISISTMPDNSIEYFAIWNVNNYVATWYFDADSVFANINLNYADTIKAPKQNPEQEGYNFLGWSATESGSVIDSFGLMPAADTAFYAVWQKIAEDKKFAILWYRNDGTPAVFITDTLAQGDSIVAPSVNPDRADYKFVGWSVTTDGETIAEFGKIVSDTAFYAVWQIQDTTTPITSTFVATWYMNNGTDSVFTASTFAQGDSIVAPSVNPNRAGYTFLGWSNEISGSLVTNFGTAAADTAFYAVWLKNKCLVLWMFEQDSVFKIDTLFYGDAIIVPEVNPVREQYAFKGWAMSGDSALVDFGTAEGSESLFYAVGEEVVVPQY